MESRKPKSPFLMELRRILLDGVRRIDNDECNEAQAFGMISRYNAESKGYYDKHSTVNYDQAMEILGIRNRTTLNEVCRLNGVYQKEINNCKIGFLRSEIDDLAYKIKNNTAKGYST